MAGCLFFGSSRKKADMGQESQLNRCSPYHSSRTSRSLKRVYIDVDPLLVPKSQLETSPRPPMASAANEGHGMSFMDRGMGHASKLSLLRGQRSHGKLTQVPSDLSLRVAATDPGIVIKAPSPHSQLSLNSTSTHPSPTAGECATGYTNNALPSNLQKQRIAVAHTYSRFSNVMAVAGPALHYDRAVSAFSLSASAPSSSSGASLFSKGCNQPPQRVDGDEDEDVDNVIAFFTDASMCTPAQTAFQRPIRQGPELPSRLVDIWVNTSTEPGPMGRTGCMGHMTHESPLGNAAQQRHAAGASSRLLSQSAPGMQPHVVRPDAVRSAAGACGNVNDAVPDLGDGVTLDVFAKSASQDPMGSRNKDNGENSHSKGSSSRSIHDDDGHHQPAGVLPRASANPAAPRARGGWRVTYNQLPISDTRYVNDDVAEDVQEETTSNPSGQSTMTMRIHMIRELHADVQQCRTDCSNGESTLMQRLRESRRAGMLRACSIRESASAMSQGASRRDLLLATSESGAHSCKAARQSCPGMGMHRSRASGQSESGAHSFKGAAGVQLPGQI